MRIPKNYLANLTASKYKEYLKLLPELHKESTKTIIMLIFSFAALSFLGIFAISPTLGTIIDLKKQLADSQFVNDELTTKMTNLSHLQQQYNLLANDLPFVYDAIPTEASVPLLVGQVTTLTRNAHIHITSFRVAQVQLAGSKKAQTTSSSFVFSLAGEGSYEDMLSFSQALARASRIVTIESLALTKDAKRNVLILDVRGRQYFFK